MTQGDRITDSDARKIVRTCLGRMTSEQGKAIARAFYAELFSRHPALEGHFAGLDLDQQAAKLWSVLRLVAACESQPGLAADLAVRIDRAHAQRGIGAGQYDAFVDVLSDVLAVAQRELPIATARRAWQQALHGVTAALGATPRAARGGARIPA